MKTLRDHSGRDVRLTDERLRHVLEHAEMANMEAAIEETLHNPQFVMGSRTDPHAELNYRFYFGTRFGDKWLCVVVKFAGNDAFILTAYLTNRIKEGVQLWPKK